MSEPILKKTTKKKLLSKTPIKSVLKSVAIKVPKRVIKDKVIVTKKSATSKPTKISIKNKTFSSRILKNPLLQKDKLKISKDSSETITLPQKADINLLKKVEFYKNLVDQKSPRYVRRIAFISGYGFIVSGFVLTLISYNLSNSDFKHQLASIICSDSSSCSTAGSTTDTTVTVTDTTSALSEPIIEPVAETIKLIEPTINFLTDVDPEPKSNFELTLKITGASDLKLFLITSTDKKLEIPVKHHDLDYYSFMIPVDTLLQETYTIKVGVIASDSLTKYYFTGSTFKIVKESAPETLSTITSEPIDEEVITEPETENTESTVTSSTIAEKTFDSDKFLIKIEPTVDSYLFKILIKSPGSNAIEIYAQSKFSTVPLFLGLARKNETGWLFFLDSRNLPIDNYAIFAKTTLNSDSISTPFVPFSTTPEMYKTPIYPTSDTGTADAITDSVIFAEKIKQDLLQTEDPVSESENVEILEQRNSYFTTLDKVNVSSDLSESLAAATSTLPNSSQIEDEIVTEVDKILQVSERDLNLLYKKYASALQSGDSNLIRVAKSEIDKYRDTLITRILIDTRTKDIADHIVRELDLEFNRLNEQVSLYEKILKDRSEQINRDTDGDGITDFDEVTLYKTDTSNPDTDNDGILDGVEIISGFDPLDAKKDTIISFHSPKDVNYIDDKNLIIDSVIPIIEANVNGDVNESPLLAEIKGKGLPNSFVTLFIYSSPTVVTVKTDADGNFSYTFTKELEDGNHEVYVAITDNRGAIVARSNPFKFIKTAEAFSPIDNEETSSSVISSECINCDDSTISSYNITAAMGVVSFGLILLMLGRTLRNRPEETVVKHDSTT